MKGKFGYLVVMGLLVVGLSACGVVGARPAATAAQVTPPEVEVQPAPADSSIQAGGGPVGQTVDGQYAQGVVVVGSGTASADPEIADVTLGVEIQGDDPAQLVSDAAERMDEVVAALVDAGVAEDDIRTTGYNLWVENIYDPDRGVPTGEVRYRVSHFIQVTVRDLEQVGEVLAAAVEAGANNVSGVNFRVEDSDTLLAQARQEALQDAQEKAQAIAQALGIELGSPVMVTEVSGGFPIPLYERAAGMGGAAEAAAPNITPGSFSVTVSMQVVYAIQ